MRKPNWDVDAGKEMWLAGKSDEQIAEALGTTARAVNLYRYRKWVPSLKEIQGIPGELPENSGEPQQKSTMPAAKKKDQKAVPEIATAVCGLPRNDNVVGSDSLRPCGAPPSKREASSVENGEGEGQNGNENSIDVRKSQLISRINRSLGLIEGITAGLGGRIAQLVTDAVTDVDAAVQELVGGSCGK